MPARQTFVLTNAYLRALELFLELGCLLRAARLHLVKRVLRAQQLRPQLQHGRTGTTQRNAAQHEKPSHKKKAELFAFVARPGSA